MKPDKNRARGIGFYMLIGVIILAVVFYLTTPVEQKEYTYSEIETLFREEKVKSFSLEGDELTLNLYSADIDGNTTIKKTLPSPNWFREDLGDLINEQTASGVLTEYDYVKGWTAPWWMSILPYLITVVLFIGVWYLLMNKAGGGGALAMAIALLGMNQCATVSMPGKMLSEDEILAQVKAGKKAYGFTDQHIEKVVPIILKGLGF